MACPRPCLPGCATGSQSQPAWHQLRAGGPCVLPHARPPVQDLLPEVPCRLHVLVHGLGRDLLCAAQPAQAHWLATVQADSATLAARQRGSGEPCRPAAAGGGARWPWRGTYRIADAMCAADWPKRPLGGLASMPAVQAKPEPDLDQVIQDPGKQDAAQLASRPSLTARVSSRAPYRLNSNCAGQAQHRLLSNARQDQCQQAAQQRMLYKCPWQDTLQEVGNGVAGGHHGGVLLGLGEVLDLPLQLVVKAQDAGHIAAAVAVVGRRPDRDQRALCGAAAVRPPQHGLAR